MIDSYKSIISESGEGVTGSGVSFLDCNKLSFTVIVMIVDAVWCNIAAIKGMSSFETILTISHDRAVTSDTTSQDFI